MNHLLEQSYPYYVEKKMKNRENKYIFLSMFT